MPPSKPLPDHSGWTPVDRWVANQPMRCATCGDVLDGREIGYIPAMCEREGCPGPGPRIQVFVTQAATDEEQQCPCGHSADDHDANGICTAKLATFPDGGFHGVCPCTPGWLASRDKEHGA